MQCNAFPRHPDLTVIAVGAPRKVAFVEETIGLIGVVYSGDMYEFSNWSATHMQWDVRWGNWQMKSTSRNGFEVTLAGVCETEDQGVWRLGPTEKGMKFTVRDAMKASLTVTLKDKKGNTVVDARSAYAQWEVGSQPWEKVEREVDEEGVWMTCVKPLPQPVRAVINLFNRPKNITDGNKRGKRSTVVFRSPISFPCFFDPIYILSYHCFTSSLTSASAREAAV